MATLFVKVQVRGKTMKKILNYSTNKRKVGITVLRKKAESNLSATNNKTIVIALQKSEDKILMQRGINYLNLFIALNLRECEI